MVTLNAYLDESGTHAGSQTIAVAGYLATPVLWSAFEREWIHALNDFGIDFFHMSDFVNGAQQYADWSDDRKRACFGRLTDIIGMNTIASVGVVFSLHDFNQAFSLELRKRIGGAYPIACLEAMATLAKFMKEQVRPEGEIAYVFDIMQKGTGHLLKLVQENLKDPQWKKDVRFLSLHFEDKKRFVPIQAADILAYELYRHYPRMAGPVKLMPRNYLRSLAFPIRHWVHLDLIELQKWATVESAYFRWAAMSRKEKQEWLERHPRHKEEQ